MVGAGKKESAAAIARNLAAVFAQGIDVIERISDDVFTAGGPRTSIGAHFRHNIEFARELLNGMKSGSVDYSARARDERIAIDRFLAIGATRDLMRELESMPATTPGMPLAVRSESVAETSSASSVARELDFLLSHTIHHYALIAFRLSALGIVLPEDFGVAPSTIEFRKRSEGESK